MAHSYLTIARDGERISGTLASSDGGPLGISNVKDEEGELVETNDGVDGQNKVDAERVLDADVAGTARSTLETVVSSGTGVKAQYGGYAWGKTGTTENNGDAWFCGATEDVTACVWVGHAETNTPMETEFAGGPVDGGTFPAIIWSDVISAYEALAEERDAGNDTDVEEEVPAAPTAPVTPAAPAPAAPAAPAPETPAPEAPPAQEAPAPAQPVTPPAAEGGADAAAADG